MIKRIKVLPAFERAEEPTRYGTERGYSGFPVDAFPIGHEVNTDSLLVLFIGNNGSGKSTALEKLEAQFMGWGKDYWYFDVNCDESGEPHRVYRCDLTQNSEEEFRNKETRSHGQLTFARISKFFKDARKYGPEEVLYFDEPENGISLRNKGRLVEMIRSYSFDNKRQIFVATHEPEFLKVAEARIINLDEHPANSCLASDFDLRKYMNAGN